MFCWYPWEGDLTLSEQKQRKSGLNVAGGDHGAEGRWREGMGEEDEGKLQSGCKINLTVLKKP